MKVILARLFARIRSHFVELFSHPRIFLSLDFYATRSIALVSSFFLIFLLVSIFIPTFHDASADEIDYNLPSVSLSVSSSNITIATTPADPLGTGSITATIISESSPYDLFVSFADTDMILSGSDGDKFISGITSPSSTLSSSWGYLLGSSSTYHIPTTTSTRVLEKAAKTPSTGTTHTLTIAAETTGATSGTYENTMTVTASSHPVEYSVFYMKNSGSDSVTGMPENYTGTIETSPFIYTLSTSTPTREGYTFCGWGKRPTTTCGSADILTSLTLDSSHPSANVYAIWRVAPRCGSDLAYMQDLTANDYAEMTTGTPVTVCDKRDDKTYSIVKLADGNVWMKSFLNFNLTSSTLPLVSSTSNVSSSWNPSTTSKYTFIGAVGDQSGKNKWSYDYGHGITYYNYYIALALPLDGYNMFDEDKFEGYTRKTETYTESGGYSASRTYYDSAQSICPKGWHLPSAYSENSPYSNLKYDDVIASIWDLRQIDSSFASFPSGNHVNTSTNSLVTSNYMWTSSLSINYGSGGTDPEGATLFDNSSSPSTLTTDYRAFPARCVADAKVLYNPNGGEGSQKSFDLEYVAHVVKDNTEISFIKTGYILKNWNTKFDGTGTSYNVGDKIYAPATLYAIWEEAGEPETLEELAAAGGSMQDLTPEICANSPEADTAGNYQYQLTDSRDGKKYYVAKLKDGNCWMTQNLNYDFRTGIGLHPSDSDVEEDWIPKPTQQQTPIATYPSGNSPGSWDSGDPNIGTYYEHLIALGFAFTSYNGNWLWDIENTKKELIRADDYNYYYNSLQSVCPAGWHLPAGSSGGSGSFANLIELYGDKNLTSPPLNFVIGGYVNQGKHLASQSSSYYTTEFHYGGGSGSWSTSAYTMTVDPYGVRYAYSGPGLSYNVRCVADGSEPAPSASCSGENKLCYDGNGADGGSMGEQPISANSTVILYASNFWRSGYGFAGWNTEPDGTGTQYGPMENFATPSTLPSEGIKLYARWIPSAGNLQDWNGCGSMNIGDVTALTDLRDNDTYAVAKLADGACWMIENLRLDNDATHNTDGSLAQGYATGFKGLANPETSNFTNNETPNSLYKSVDFGYANMGFRIPRYNNINTSSPATNPVGDSSYDRVDANIYSYGNYYTWPAAIADIGSYVESSGGARDFPSTSICPKGWSLPLGGNNNNNGAFYHLNYILNDNSNGTGATASAKLRAYPNNFILSGSYSDSSPSGRGGYSKYWTSSIPSGYIYYAYGIGISHNEVGPGTNNTYIRNEGSVIRCLIQ